MTFSPRRSERSGAFTASRRGQCPQRMWTRPCGEARGSGNIPAGRMSATLPLIPTRQAAEAPEAEPRLARFRAASKREPVDEENRRRCARQSEGKVFLNPNDRRSPPEGGEVGETPKWEKQLTSVGMFTRRRPAERTDILRLFLKLVHSARTWHECERSSACRSARSPPLSRAPSLSPSLSSLRSRAPLPEGGPDDGGRSLRSTVRAARAQPEGPLRRQGPPHHHHIERWMDKRWMWRQPSSIFLNGIKIIII